MSPKVIDSKLIRAIPPLHVVLPSVGWNRFLSTCLLAVVPSLLSLYSGGAFLPLLGWWCLPSICKDTIMLYLIFFVWLIYIYIYIYYPFKNILGQIHNKEADQVLVPSLSIFGIALVLHGLVQVIAKMRSVSVQSDTLCMLLASVSVFLSSASSPVKVKVKVKVHSSCQVPNSSTPQMVTLDVVPVSSSFHSRSVSHHLVVECGIHGQ